MVYVNAAFSQLTGYAASALIGTNLRMLQGEDREQECATAPERRRWSAASRAAC